MGEIIYDFLLALQDETKKLMDYKTNFLDDFDFYLNEVIAPIANNKDAMDSNRMSKLFFYYFNNLRRHLNEDAYKIRHTILSDKQYALEVLQTRDRPYFINRLLELFKGDTTSLNLSIVDDLQNNFEKIKIVNDTIDNLTICQDYYSNIYANIGTTVSHNLLNLLQFLLKKWIKI